MTDPVKSVWKPMAKNLVHRKRAIRPVFMEEDTSE